MYLKQWESSEFFLPLILDLQSCDFLLNFVQGMSYAEQQQSRNIMAQLFSSGTSVAHLTVILGNLSEFCSIFSPSDLSAQRVNKNTSWANG